MTTSVLTPPIRTDLPPRDTSQELPPDGLIDWTPDGGETFHAQIVHFELDKAVVKSTEISKVEAVAARMKAEFKGKGLRIEGHCDERGTEEYNRSLGERRALAIREALLQMGLAPNMVVTLSFGEDKPVDPGHNEGAWKKNRRGEFILLTRPNK